jgi:transcriptional regulator with XRE-family HTH domain
MRFLRVLHNMTLEELAARIAVDRSDLARIEKGLLRPSKRVRARLEAYFGPDIDSLLCPLTEAEFRPTACFISRENPTVSAFAHSESVTDDPTRKASTAAGVSTCQ